MAKAAREMRKKSLGAPPPLEPEPLVVPLDEELLELDDELLDEDEEELELLLELDDELLEELEDEDELDDDELLEELLDTAACTSTMAVLLTTLPAVLKTITL
jgi:hypothetical protein